METQEIDSETAYLIALGTENMIGILGLLATQDEAANDSKHSPASSL